MTIKKEWKKLTDYQHVRMRTEVLFGSRSIRTIPVLNYKNAITKQQTSFIPAIFVCLREIIDNSLDELITQKFGDCLEVDYDQKTMIMTVRDNGRGIPIDFDKTEQEYAATVLLSHTKSGRNFVDSERENTRGLNGIGAKGVNFCSEFFEVEIYRDKKSFSQCFSEGTEENDNLVVEAPVILPAKARKTGTEIRFKLSTKVFDNLYIGLPEEFISARLYEIALVNPQIKVIYNGKKIKPKTFDELLPDNINFTVETENFRAQFYLKDNFSEEFMFHSIVNSIPCFDGGVQVDAFKRYFIPGILNALTRESNKRKLKLAPRDISDVLLVYAIIDMKAPFFDSQSKTKLTNEEVSTFMKEAFTEDFFKRIVQKNEVFVNGIFERCADRTLAKENKDVQKLGAKNKKAKIAELEDACGKDRTKCILMLAEGLSAIAGLVAARDPEIHGGLPLRGKPMNVREEAASVVLKNEVLAKVMATIGLVPGVRPNRRMLRYGKIYITTDADEDGKNIAALLVNFFYTFWKDLFDPAYPPFIYVFDTPLIIAVKGKVRKFWYNDDIHKFDGDDYKGWEITRAKGLAALKKEDWKQILVNPKLIPITDDGELDNALDLLFNKDKASADKRKVWIGM